MNNKKFLKVGFAYCNTARSFSKDPSSKVGAAILRPTGALVSSGWNGFAPGVEDTEARLSNREIKYSLMLHAELNAILTANTDLTGCILFSYPYPPCAHCASVIIKSGITRVISYAPEQIPERWHENFKLAQEIFKEAKVEFEVLRELPKD